MISLFTILTGVLNFSASSGSKPVFTFRKSGLITISIICFVATTNSSAFCEKGLVLNDEIPRSKGLDTLADVKMD